MADNDQPSRLEAATIKAEAGSDIVYRVANLPADQTVATDSGNIPTLAGVLDYVQNEGDAAAADVRAKADAQVQAAIGTLVKKAGDTMTGALTLSGNPTANLHASPKQFVDAGDAKALADAKTYTDQKTASIVVSKYFQADNISIAFGSTGSATHNFGSIPKFVNAYLQCVTADNGFSPGEIIRVPHHMVAYPGNSGNLSGAQIITTTTTVSWTVSATLPFAITPKGRTDGLVAGATPANWRLYINLLA